MYRRIPLFVRGQTSFLRTTRRARQRGSQFGWTLSVRSQPDGALASCRHPQLEGFFAL